MPSSIHEALVELLRGASARILDLLHDAIAIESIADLDASAARIVDATVPQLAPARMCDLAIEVPMRAPLADGPTGAAVILEIQERKDRRKELSWPIYWATMRARAGVRGGPVWLVVITTRNATERWATNTLGHVIPPAGRWGVIGPSTMARITDPIAAHRDPDAALLSGLIHAGHRDVDLVRAIAEACSTLPPERGMLFLDAITSRLSRYAITALEAQMQKAGYEWKSEFALRHRAEGREQGLKQGREQGREEGREEGRAETARDALLTVIESRSLALTRQQRTTIEKCSSVARLQDWLRRAAIATTTGEIFGAREPGRATKRSHRRAARPRARRSTRSRTS